MKADDFFSSLMGIRNRKPHRKQDKKTSVTTPVFYESLSIFDESLPVFDESLPVFDESLPIFD